MKNGTSRHAMIEPNVGFQSQYPEEYSIKLA